MQTGLSCQLRAVTLAVADAAQVELPDEQPAIAAPIALDEDVAEEEPEADGRMSWWRHSGMRSRRRAAPSTNSLSARPCAVCADEHTPAPYCRSGEPANSLAGSGSGTPPPPPLVAPPHSPLDSPGGAPTRGEPPSKPATQGSRTKLVTSIYF